MKTRIFYDFEATSVARDTDPISIGLVAVTEKYKPLHNVTDGLEIKTFYAEFDDFNIDKADNWVKENVINKLKFNNQKDDYWNVISEGCVECKGNFDLIKLGLISWLSQFESIEFWADYDTIDKPMLVDLISEWTYNYVTLGNVVKVGLPKHLSNVAYYDFYDLHTVFKIKGIDPDINRVDYSEVISKELPHNFILPSNHNALYDAYVSYQCYNKLMK